jgi:hypothetical protein
VTSLGHATPSRLARGHNQWPVAKANVTEAKQGETMPLEHLFDAELEYQSAMAAIAEDGEGKLVGSGDGSVHGERLHGALRWTLFEGPGELFCTMNPALAIDTEDGGSIAIQARGYGRRASPTDQLWRVAATLLFRTEDERYRWLNGAIGVWEGEFDSGQARASYRAFIQSPANGEADR